MLLTNELFNEKLRDSVNLFHKKLQTGMNAYNKYIKSEKEDGEKDSELYQYISNIWKDKQIPPISLRQMKVLSFKRNEVIRDVSLLQSTIWLYLILGAYMEEMIQYLENIDENFLKENNTDIEIIENTVKIQLSVLYSLYSIADTKYDEWVPYEGQSDYQITAIKRGLVDPTIIQ